MDHPVAVLVPTLAVAAAPRVAVPARPLQRAGRHDPAARACRRAPPSTGSTRDFGEGEFAPIVLADPDRRARRRPGEHRGAVRLLAPARGRPADRPRRQPRRRRPAADARPVPAPLRRPGGPPRPIRRRRRSRATTKGDLTAFTLYDAVRPEPRRGPGARRATCATRTGAARATGRATVLVGGGAADVEDVVDARRAPTSRGPRCSSSSRPTSCCSLLLRSVVLPAKALVDEHAVDRRQLRRARLDLPGRQPVGARSASSRSASSRRRSR